MKLIDKPFMIEACGKKSKRMHYVVKYGFLVLIMTSTFTYAEDIDPSMKTVTDIVNTNIQSEIFDCKKNYKDEFDIRYEDMSRKGQLNGTSMLDLISEFCFNEIDDCARLIRNTLLRIVNDSGISFSDELATELKTVVKSHLTGEIGNISGYIKHKDNLGSTLEAQLAIRETELNNKRTNELKKINSEIDLLSISSENQEKETAKVEKSEKQVKIPNPSNSSWLQKNKDPIIVGIIILLFGYGVKSLFRYIAKPPLQKQTNLKSISNKGVISQTTINGDAKGEVVEGDKVFGDKNVYQEQKPEASLVSYFQEALSIMPKLFKNMARALKDEKTKLVREFFVLRNRNVKIGVSTKPRLSYFEEDYENLQNKLDILEDYGFINDVRVDTAPIYRMTPEFVKFLLTDIEIT